MRVGIPAPSSRFHSAAWYSAASLLQLRSGTKLSPSVLNISLPSDALGMLDIAFCRGRDIAELVGAGVLDLGFTGYDAWVEASLKSDQLSVRAWHVGSSRPTQLALAGRSDRLAEHPTTVYSEYPVTTQAFFRSQRNTVNVVPLRGSSEGLVNLSPETSCCVVSVQSGKTIRDCELSIIEVLLNSDLCLLSSSAFVTGAHALLNSTPTGARAAALPSFVAS